MDFNVIITAYIIKLEEVGAGPLVCEGVEALVVVHALGQRESDCAVVELLHLWPAARRRLDDLHFDDLDGVSTGSVPGSHVTVALSDGTSDTEVTVLAVHVVYT